MNMTYERIQQCNNVTMCTFNNVKCPYIYIYLHTYYMYIIVLDRHVYTLSVLNINFRKIGANSRLKYTCTFVYLDYSIPLFNL